MYATYVQMTVFQFSNFIKGNKNQDSKKNNWCYNSTLSKKITVKQGWNILFKKC